MAVFVGFDVRQCDGFEAETLEQPPRALVPPLEDRDEMLHAIRIAKLVHHRAHRFARKPLAPPSACQHVRDESAAVGLDGRLHVADRLAGREPQRPS